MCCFAVLGSAALLHIALYAICIKSDKMEPYFTSLGLIYCYYVTQASEHNENT